MEPETYQDRVERLAREVIDTWNTWAQADGWDNDEYDPFAVALLALEQALDEKPSIA